MKNGSSGLSLPVLNSSQGVQSLVIAIIWMSINKLKMSLCPGQLTVEMVSVSENGTVHSHRIWKTKDYSCCVMSGSLGDLPELP